MGEDYFMQYAIAGFRNGKWYREHPNFETLETAKKYLNENKYTSQFKRYEKFKIQVRKITKWENINI